MSKQSNAQPSAAAAAAAVRIEKETATVPNFNFPFQLHRFVTETTDVAGWSKQGDQFFINYNDPELLSRLMGPLFGRKSLKCGSASSVMLRRIFLIRLTSCNSVLSCTLYPCAGCFFEYGRWKLCFSPSSIECLRVCQRQRLLATHKNVGWRSISP